MQKNLGKVDRALRGLGGAAFLVSAILLPLSMEARLGLGIMGIYVTMSALAGSCLGYRLLGMSSCPLGSR